MRLRLQNARRPMSLAAAVLFVALAAIGGWRAFDGIWTSVGQQRLAYRGLTPFERQNDAASGLVDVRVLDFWAARVRRGDRFYLNLPRSTAAFVASPQVLGEITGYYLVPAEQVADPKKATVVLSWGQKPARAGLRLSSSLKVPGTDASFSRVAAP